MPSRSTKKRKKYCPEGVREDCLYCVRQDNGSWTILNQKGIGVDDASSRHEAMSVAEGYIAQCEASRSGYGGKKQKRLKFNWGRGGFSW